MTDNPLPSDPPTAPRHVLWTGGWDSTFWILYLTFIEKRPVQPHYLLLPTRGSTPYELHAMEEIRSAVARRDGSGLLLDTHTFDTAHLPVQETTREMHRALTARYNIGIQYLWIAAYAHYQQINSLDLCIHIDDKAYHPATVLRESSDIHSDAPETLFKHLSFPILDLSKPEMNTAARKHGFLDILNHSWFCHNPTRSGRPCGFCGPCRWTAEEGLDWRLPFSSKMRRALVDHIIRKVPGFRLRRLIRKRTDSLMRQLG